MTDAILLDAPAMKRAPRREGSTYFIRTFA